MKFMKYCGWEVYLYSIDMSGMRCYFAAAPEIIQVRMSGESLWDAFERLREELDKIEAMLNYEFDDSDAPF